ncbi:DUF3802 family protein [Psychromonas sp. MME2]|uniref:DUF3802 family protein n=1 Tax=unclassified Psychromonas TaxID=2614957 RepID=UPI00339CD5D7
MLLESDAYKACVGYFADNLDIFEGQINSEEGDIIADIVSDQVVDMLLCFCQQQPHLSNETRLTVVAEGDKLVDDLEQILGQRWNKPANRTQIDFIKEYFLLIKNSLDSQVMDLP